MLTRHWLDDSDGQTTSPPHHRLNSRTRIAAISSMSHHQSTPSDGWDFVSVPGTSDFVEDIHTDSREPHFNGVNIPSSRIGYDTATLLEQDFDAAARTQRAISNEDSTETAGTNDTGPADDAVTQYPSGMAATTYSPTPYPDTAYSQTPYDETAYTPNMYSMTAGNHPGLTRAGMEYHHDRTHPYDIATWAGYAGIRRLNVYQAGSQRYSSSVASTKSAASNTSMGWVQVPEPANVDENVLFMGAWSDEQIQAAYGTARPGGHRH